MPDRYVCEVRVLSVIHGRLVRAELFGDVIVEGGHELVEWDIRKQEQPPGAFDAVIVFGGEQNVGEEDKHPWLLDEYALLRSWVAAETPLLGVCLGAQTLAHSAGAIVHRAPQQQLGFLEVSLTPAGVADPVLGALPARFEALYGNSYAFDVPPRGVELASSPTASQAFRLGERAWGVQFHPEARRDQVLAWFAEDDPLPRPLPELVGELDAGIVRWHELGRDLCNAFLDAAAS
jgi:GMP synthase-like glutamine amidotransferase